MTLVLDEMTAPLRRPAKLVLLKTTWRCRTTRWTRRIAEARARLGATTVILGHHYQRDEVVRFADFTGDSYKLSKIAAASDAKYIVFCGVHFMAESADVLAREGQQVILPDLNAGCSMADMAEISQVEDCWDALERAGLADETIPVTYINSTAAIKAFCGEHGGLVCTSSSARGAMEWAFARGKRILFLPDQHLGRNTGHAMGIPLEEMAVWDPWAVQIGSFWGGQTKERLAASRILLWKGHCAVHQRFLPSACGPGAREVSRNPGDCASRVPLRGLPEGRRAGIDRAVDCAGGAGAGGIDVRHRDGDSPGEPAGAGVCAAGKKIITLDDTGCLCTTMYRITPQHLAWALENLVEGRVVNRVQVKADVKHWARVALDRMIGLGNRE